MHFCDDSGDFIMIDLSHPLRLAFPFESLRFTSSIALSVQRPALHGPRRFLAQVDPSENPAKEPESVSIARRVDDSALSNLRIHGCHKIGRLPTLHVEVQLLQQIAKRPDMRTGAAAVACLWRKPWHPTRQFCCEHLYDDRPRSFCGTRCLLPCLRLPRSGPKARARARW